MKKQVEIVSLNKNSETKEYAASTGQQRMDAMFYMQNHWIVENKKITNMDISADFYLQFIDLLNKHEVQYMLIGGFAVNYYGYPRTTHDMDLWVNSHPDNSKKLLAAIDEFGYDIEILKGVYLKGKEAIKLPHTTIPFKKIEILADLSGLYDFAQCYENRKIVEYNETTLSFISYTDLLKNKQASTRIKDQDDIKILKEVAEEIERNKKRGVGF